MKKIATCCLLILFFPVMALAAPRTIDLDTMPLQDLLSLKLEIDNAILAAGLSDTAVPQGVYVVGEHIPAGEYTVSVESASSLCIMDIYQDETAYYNNAEWIDTFTISYYSKLGRVWLYDGNIVVLSGPAVFSVFTGLGS